ncbi:HTH domain-containing protein [Lactobacillus sp. DCY120]|uniref:HTH domain-containing protein n=1 Tax=Bombilactobacillus apium TaxID=2675299 RepID=A0A850R145_9LACO|nr:HTH domain-containing protein [Bombilactobacillus apium]NVY96080.1 HTH domain-containing protein [Bombilactobacillus apium]
MQIEEIMWILQLGKRYESLFILLLRQEGFVTSRQLARSLAVSPRTIKSDLTTLQSYLAKQEEIQIQAQRAHGYRLQVQSPQLLQQLRERLQLASGDILTAKEQRVLDLCRILLSQKKPQATWLLQQRLLINANNSLSFELDQVRQICRRYRLQLTWLAQQGWQIQGAFSCRLLLLVRTYQYLGLETHNSFPDYERLFQFPIRQRQKLQEQFWKILTKSELAFSDVTSQRFLTLLIVLHNWQQRWGLPEKSWLPAADLSLTAAREVQFVQDLKGCLQQNLALQLTSELQEFLIQVTVMSVDLYHYRDLSWENYGHLYPQAQNLVTELLQFFQEEVPGILNNDYTGFKDLSKVFLPIALKINWEIADDVDLSLYNDPVTLFSPLVQLYLQQALGRLEERYHYYFSQREQNIIANIIQGIINRLHLPHRKLRLAVIALNGKLSTQQIKFNLLHYFGRYIECVDSRSLYELREHQKNYDYYLCGSYGRNMNIDLRPIFFVDETISQSEYVESLEEFFFKSYQYDDFLPPITIQKVTKPWQFTGSTYGKLELQLPTQQKLELYANLHSDYESLQIFLPPTETQAVVVVIDTQIAEQGIKFKMLANVCLQIVKFPQVLGTLKQQPVNSYATFFKR